LVFAALFGGFGWSSAQAEASLNLLISDGPPGASKHPISALSDISAWVACTVFGAWATPVQALIPAWGAAAANSWASRSIVAAGTPQISAAHSGVRAIPSSSPRSRFLNSAKP
jgi:hypothetical protein